PGPQGCRRSAGAEGGAAAATGPGLAAGEVDSGRLLIGEGPGPDAENPVAPAPLAAGGTQGLAGAPLIVWYGHEAFKFPGPACSRVRVSSHEHSGPDCSRRESSTATEAPGDQKARATSVRPGESSA